MQLAKKKQLAAKVLNVGKDRIVFSNANLTEIKEAITRQDILDLHKQGIIKIKEEKGRRKIVKRKRRRGIGKVKKKLNTRKKDYVILTRKLRSITKSLLKRDKINKDKYNKIRKMIKAKKFKSKRHLNESLEEI
ncbi:MAG: 50S ribosomal protein L19e [Nanoarchaeota archaeon]